MPQSLAIRTTVSTPVAPAQEFAVRAAEDGPAGVADRRIRLAEDAFAAARLACAPSVQPERRSLRL